MKGEVKEMEDVKTSIILKAVMVSITGGTCGVIYGAKDISVTVSGVSIRECEGKAIEALDYIYSVERFIYPGQEAKDAEVGAKDEKP